MRPSTRRSGGRSKRDIKPWVKRRLCIPEVGAQFVWRVEDVLGLYEELYDPLRPVVCFDDERACRLIGDVSEPLPPNPGQPAKVDSHCERKGTCQLFMALEPLTGWREARLTERRRRREFTHSMQHLAEKTYPRAESILVVCNSLSTRTAASTRPSLTTDPAFGPEDRIRLHTGAWILAEQGRDSWIPALVKRCLGKR
jgi:hypothetical protein